MERGAGYPVQAAVRAALGKWISITEAPDAASVQSLRRDYRLDLGEGEAIVVAETVDATLLLMDEQRGVRYARQRGLTVVRTPLIYAHAAIRGLIGSVREKLDELRARGFWLTDRYYDSILRETGERR